MYDLSLPSYKNFEKHTLVEYYGGWYPNIGGLDTYTMPSRDGFAARISEKNRVKKKNRDIDMNTFSKFLDRSVLVSA